MRLFELHSTHRAGYCCLAKGHPYALREWSAPPPPSGSGPPRRSRSDRLRHRHPLLGAGAASAAEGLNWDKVAECESGGSWSQNSGNGYYGGLQLTQGDWEKYGGLDYATSPDQASRGQQIAVAEKILDDQGVGAWRTCGLLAGLDKGSPAADGDTGVGGDSGSGASDSYESSGSSSSSPSPSTSPSSSATTEEGLDLLGAGRPIPASPPMRTAVRTRGEPDPRRLPSASADAKGGASDKSQKNTDASANEGTGRHRGASADEGKTEAAPSGRHASGGLNAWGGTVAEAPGAGDGAIPRPSPTPLKWAADGVRSRVWATTSSVASCQVSSLPPGTNRSESDT
ncbi:hypothetical protein SHKM778_85800 [Streptomyces sp. KM77-8]|uniref:Resuscitation-promoting factor core lysozyme-like domain-containing protein n=1 Tax=Streptomyces haneummycinicus TaxID=3074435 RepID=A0AAT9HXS9_9ACTN